MNPVIPIPTVGRTVLYVLSEEEAQQINRRHTDNFSIAERIKEGKWPLGAQAHIGNPVAAGEVYPATVVRQWGGDNPQPTSCVNLKVHLDGTDDLWTTSRSHDPAKTPGTFHWPAIAAATKA